MMERRLNILVAGALDCGKSTLIGRLLYDSHCLPRETEQKFKKTTRPDFALLLDSFQEERLGQFTLDTTQVFVDHKNRQYIFIDVPGHKELLKNMLTGASYADAAILVIDIQKVLEGQTKRHLYILKFLGIEPIILVINKMDSVRYKEEPFRKALNEINIFLRKIQIIPTYTIPISANEGQGLLKKSKEMSWYKGPCLYETIMACIKKYRVYDFRFPIQDIYEIKGERIAVGTILSGKIKIRDKVTLYPYNKDLRIKQIKVFKKRYILQAKSPQSIGLIIEGQERLRRGLILYKGKPPMITRQICTTIFCLKDLRKEENLTLLCSTQNILAKISQIDTVMDTIDFNIHKGLEIIKENEAVKIVMDLDKPIATERFEDLPSLGRFILQKDSEICAVGIIS